ncbi:MAG: hypothetical protein U5K70_04410 [Halodesulfurarchaeum sp.]|nr:hypothetical protein [Halodesulfurarchaeum sp.]
MNQVADAHDQDVDLDPVPVDARQDMLLGFIEAAAEMQLAERWAATVIGGHVDGPDRLVEYLQMDGEDRAADQGLPADVPRTGSPSRSRG